MSKLLIQPRYRITIAGAPITPEILDCNIEITMDSAFEADTFMIDIFNVDQIIQTFINEGALVIIELGYNAIFIPIITGIITKTYNKDSQSESIIAIEGIDRVIFQLKSTIINLTINNPRDIIDIIKDICIRSGVVLNPATPPSNIRLDNYSISEESAFNAIRKLVDRLKYNVTAKSNILYVTPTISTNDVAAAITDELGFRLTKTGGVSQDDRNKSKGYNFFGAGLPVLTPMKIVTVALTEQRITGNFIIETIVHKYNSKTGYKCIGTLIEPSAVKNDSSIVQYSTTKTISSLLNDKMDNFFKKKIAIQSAEVEEFFTDNRNLNAKIGFNEDFVKGSVVPSVEAILGDKNVQLIKKPLVSSFAGNGFGLLVPVYKDMRAIVGSNNYDLQDSNIIGFLFKKTDTIPAHDAGDYMLHHKNHSKYVMKESGDEIKQIKSLKIEIGDSFLTINNPSSTSNGDLEITFSNGDKLTRIGTEWIIDSSSIKIGDGASKGAARLDDQTIINNTTDPTWIAWLNALLTALKTIPPVAPTDGGLVAFTAYTTAIALATTPIPSSLTGKINQASSKVKIE